MGMLLPYGTLYELYKVPAYSLQTMVLPMAASDAKQAEATLHQHLWTMCMQHEIAT